MHRCFVFLEARTGVTTRSDPTACRTRLAPASTFKIPHAVLGLETGAVTLETVERWDGTPHPGMIGWDRDHTVTSALQPSVVWFFQRLAPRIGAARMRRWLRRIGYGNARTDGDVTRYWLNGTLFVSPDEQVAVLDRFFREQLPARPEYQRAVERALAQPPGTVASALGIRTLPGDWSGVRSWTVKTGRTQYRDRRVGWLVGRLGTGDRTVVFASAVWADGADLDPAAASDFAAAELARLGFVR